MKTKIAQKNNLKKALLNVLEDTKLYFQLVADQLDDVSYNGVMNDLIVAIEIAEKL